MTGFPPVDQAVPDKNVIFERECYVTIFNQLVEIIQNPRTCDPYFQNVVIGGNPGIGKSRFYLYCAFRLALDDAVRKSLPSEFQLVLNFESDYRMFDPVTRSFVRVVDTAKLYALSRNPNVVRLVEAHSNHLHGWPGITVLHTSPGHPAIHRFLKNHGMMFVMPTWSLQELRTYNAIPKPNPPMDDAVLVRQFNKCGGIPRSIFNIVPSVFEGLLNEALNSYKSSTVIDFVVRASSSSETKYSHRLLEMVPTTPNLQVAYRLEFLSNYIAARVVEQLSIDNTKELSAFFIAECANGASTTSSLAGVIYEMLSHRRIENSRGTLCLTFRPLTGATTYTLAIPHDLQVVAFETLDDIRAIPLGTTYFKPKAKNFGALDAFILVAATQTCYGLQMTINRDHGIKSSALGTFQAFLPRLNVTSFFFNFVVPEALASKYPAQTLRTVKNSEHTKPPKSQQSLAQYVVGLDVF